MDKKTKIPWIKRIFMTWNKLEEYFSYTNKENESLLSEKDERIRDLKQDKIDNKIEIGALKKEIENLKSKINSNDIENGKLTEKYYEIKNTNRNLEMNIGKKLETLSRIEETFFAKTGNIGKAKLGELQVKTILEKSGLNNELWTENLNVGKTYVEFAIRSSDEEKRWIPVDSKVLDAKIDDNEKIIIDEEYLKRVKQQAKEITKYLSKKNTAGYGILVLQNDSIFLAINEISPIFFRNILNDFNVFIASPCSFVQMASSISRIVDNYEKTKDHIKNYNEIVSILNSVALLVKNLKKVHYNFNMAMDKHAPLITKKHDKLQNRFTKYDDKIKKIE